LDKDIFRDKYAKAISQLNVDSDGFKVPQAPRPADGSKAF